MVCGETDWLSLPEVTYEDNEDRGGEKLRGMDQQERQPQNMKFRTGRARSNNKDVMDPRDQHESGAERRTGSIRQMGLCEGTTGRKGVA